MKHKIVAGIAIFEGLILLLLFLVCQLDDGQGLFGGCGGEIYSSAKSPDKKWVAYAFERDCGATTGFASWVIIRSVSQKLDLSAPLEENEIVFGADGDFHLIFSGRAKTIFKSLFLRASRLKRRTSLTKS